MEVQFHRCSCIILKTIIVYSEFSTIQMGRPSRQKYMYFIPVLIVNIFLIDKKKEKVKKLEKKIPSQEILFCI